MPRSVIEDFQNKYAILHATESVQLQALSPYPVEKTKLLAAEEQAS